MRRLLALILPAAALLLAACAPPPSPPPMVEILPLRIPRVYTPLAAIPPVTTDNRAALVVAGSSMTPSASSSYPGWPVTNATDGDIHTSWYSNTNDSAAKGNVTFFQIEFASPQTVRRVTILGNRDPSYLKGYTILEGRLELFDRSHRYVARLESKGTGNLRDFDFVFAKPILDVKIVRFTSLEDEGDKNAYGDVAIAEFQVE
jgi:hypothetical protein